MDLLVAQANSPREGADGRAGAAGKLIGCLEERRPLFETSTRRRIAAALLKLTTLPAPDSEAMDLVRWRVEAHLGLEEYEEALKALNSQPRQSEAWHDPSWLVLRLNALNGLRRGSERLEIIIGLSHRADAPAENRLVCMSEEIAMASRQAVRHDWKTRCAPLAESEIDNALGQGAGEMVRRLRRSLSEAVTSEGIIEARSSRPPPPELVKLGSKYLEAQAFRAATQVFETIPDLEEWPEDPESCETLIGWVLSSYVLWNRGITVKGDMDAVIERAQACADYSLSEKHEFERYVAWYRQKEGRTEEALEILRILLRRYEKYPYPNLQVDRVAEDYVAVLRLAGRNAEADAEELKLITRVRVAAGIDKGPGAS